jgi:hypothetical protein
MPGQYIIIASLIVQRHTLLLSIIDLLSNVVERHRAERPLVRRSNAPTS